MSVSPIRNRLLASLPHDQQMQLLNGMGAVSFASGATLHNPGEKFESVYFPETGFISIVAELQDGATVEVGLIGREGVLGGSAMFGVNKAVNRAVWQTGGSAYILNTASFRRAAHDGSLLGQHVGRFQQALLVQSMQTAACNREHEVPGRLARWLLMSYDRIDSDVLEITHEFLGDMLGARRATVTLAAQMLQRLGAIEYRRGKVRLLDREKLRAWSANVMRSCAKNMRN